MEVAGEYKLARNHSCQSLFAMNGNVRTSNFYPSQTPFDAYDSFLYCPYSCLSSGKDICSECLHNDGFVKLLS